MEEKVSSPAKNRYAVVTGANKGIGFEICRQLASNGITVVLTARDEKRGTEALEKLRGSGLSDLVVFHQLDVVDPSSIASLADFVKTQFGRLDILDETILAVVPTFRQRKYSSHVKGKPYFEEIREAPVSAVFILASGSLEIHINRMRCPIRGTVDNILMTHQHVQNNSRGEIVLYSWPLGNRPSRFRPGIAGCSELSRPSVRQSTVWIIFMLSSRKEADLTVTIHGLVPSLVLLQKKA